VDEVEMLVMEMLGLIEICERCMYFEVCTYKQKKAKKTCGPCTTVLTVSNQTQLGKYYLKDILYCNTVSPDAVW
jgi:hypothetical protein